MKKNIILIMSFTLFHLGCGSDTSASKNSQEKNDTATLTEKKEMPNELQKFKTVREMLKSAGDYNEDNHTLKFISESENKLHVQVSKPIFDKDLEKVKLDIVKRDIVYVVFQTFAQTDVNQITVTAIPVMQSDYKKYVTKYKKTVTVKREKAKEIIKKYLSSEDFGILYEYDKGFWLPSKEFSILKFENLSSVFDSISTN